MSRDVYSNRPLLDKLGVKPGSKVAVVNVDPSFIESLRERASSVVQGKPRTPCDLVFLGATRPEDLERIPEVKQWIEPDGAVWVIRPKGGRGEVGEMDVMNAGLATGLVDNKIASFSDTHSAMRFVYRLHDRPK